jgi:leucyl aminopeptidase (aminopeptidase T)
MITGTLEYLRRPLAANISPGGKVLILSDTAHDSRVWQAAMSIISELGADPALALFEPRPADYYDPPPVVAEAMLCSTVNVLMASTGMLHSEASAAAMARGIPSLCFDGGMRLEWLQSGAATADYREIQRLKHHVGKNVLGRHARQLRVTSGLGTDLTFRVDDRIFFPPSPPGEGFDPYAAQRMADEGRGGPALYCLVFPGGEFTIAPIEGSGNGKCFIDLSMHHLGRLYSPVELNVVDGRIVSIEGGVEARVLREYIRTYGDENAWCFPAEASIGLNRNAVVRGNQREDKVILGSMHFGLGTNIDVGGTLRSKMHLDGVILEPTLYVDDEMRIENGRFMASLYEEAAPCRTLASADAAVNEA